MVWTRACDVGDVGDGEAIVVKRDHGGPIALFKVEGEFYANEDTCPHGQYSLADGYIEGDIVECPLHAAKFDIRTGAVLCLPAVRGLEHFPVKVEDGGVFIDIGDS